jgi:intracellular multiplication protein IcmJ
MRYYPISLSVKRPNWGAKTAGTKRTVGTIGDEAKAKIFQRDDHTCQCCGFRAEKYQQVLHINGDDRDWHEENVLTTCIFCHQCFDLFEVGKMDSGMLIWLPELTQSQLHHVMRSIYLGRVAQGGLADAAKDVYNALIQRGEETRKRLGSTDPKSLALILRDFLTHKQYLDAQTRLDGIRLLPLDRRMVPEADGSQYNEFPQILAHWRSKNGPFAAMPPQDWGKLFGDLQAA